MRECAAGRGDFIVARTPAVCDTRRVKLSRVTTYATFLKELKTRIATAHVAAARAVNRELILLYWDIGRGIVEKQEAEGWGEAVVERLARDLRRAFPDMRGFSAQNLWAMRRVYLEYARDPILQQLVEELARGKRQRLLQKRAGSAPSRDAAPFLQQLVEEIPWGHHLLLLDKIKEPAGRLYYLRATAQFGWSRNVLLHQIKAGAYDRAVREKKTHNFALALPARLAAQADEMLRSRYNLEFLGITRAVTERQIEGRLLERVQQFILELGYGFCFVGRQHRVSIGKKEYFVDLLFYHRFLKALVAFDLKVGAFEPEHAGKMDFYLNVLNATERAPDDKPSIGVILCAEKDDIEVEFALKSKANPIGVAEYRLRQDLPAAMQGRMPTAKQLADVVRECLPARRK